MMALRNEQHDGRNVVEFRRRVVAPVEVASREVLPASDPPPDVRASSRHIVLAWLGVIVGGLLIWAAAVVLALAYLP